jgi:PAS domain S-box-containing protein
MSDGEAGEPRSESASGTVPLDVIPLHSTNLLTVLDENGVVQYESPSIERIYGFEQDELVGDHVAEYFHPDDREAVVAAFHAVVDGDDDAVETVEYRHERADGTYCWVESAASADPTPEGRYVVNTRDISDRKARERELVRTNERLDEFVDVVSHDLRNPLQVARGRLELAARDCDSEHIPKAVRAHDRMASLIEDLLALARDGDEISDPGPVELAAVVADCWAHVETGEATLAAATDRVVRADRSRLQQLLENLFRNAVEHGSTSSRSEAGDSLEHGSTSSRPRADDPVEHGSTDSQPQADDGETRPDRGVTVEVGDLTGGFYVEDDGPGIPDRERGRVFDPGYSGADGGTGVGLSIVEQVADAHGWTVRVSDATDGGARFEFTGVDTVARE